jgi:hypothetical protein
MVAESFSDHPAGRWSYIFTARCSPRDEPTTGEVRLDELGDSAPLDDIRDRVAAMWSMAHGMATLLIDGTLEHKVGPVTDRQALVRAIAAHSGLAGPSKAQP